MSLPDALLILNFAAIALLMAADLAFKANGRIVFLGFALAALYMAVVIWF